jgi:hypothetical protein
VAGTGKIGFGPACAAAGPGSTNAAAAAAPAAAAIRSRREVFPMLMLPSDAPHASNMRSPKKTGRKNQKTVIGTGGWVPSPTGLKNG